MTIIKCKSNYGPSAQVAGCLKGLTLITVISTYIFFSHRIKESSLNRTITHVEDSTRNYALEGTINHEKWIRKSTTSVT